VSTSAVSTFRLRVGGLTLRASGPAGSLRPPRAMLPFLARAGGDIDLEWADSPLSPPPQAAPAFDSGGPWRVFQDGEGWLFEFLLPGEEGGLVTEAVAIDAGISRGRLHVTPVRRRRFALTYPVAEILFHHRFALEGHVVAHACGVAIGKRVVLLCGQSGAGKSTLARLVSRHLPAALVLSDDRVVVRRHGDGFRAFGTPWHGLARFGAAASAPLAAVFFLRHASRTEVRPLTPVEASARLFCRTFPPPWLREGVERTLGACTQIATAVPSFDLGFRPDASAVAAVAETSRAVSRR
jgi:hypothetical protein